MAVLSVNLFLSDTFSWSIYDWVTNTFGPLANCSNVLIIIYCLNFPSSVYDFLSSPLSIILMSEVSCSGRLRLELVEKLTFSVVEFCSMIFLIKNAKWQLRRKQRSFILRGSKLDVYRFYTEETFLLLFCPLLKHFNSYYLL